MFRYRPHAPTWLTAILLFVSASAQALAQRDGLLQLTQSPPRPLALKALPAQVELGPVIPGLRQGAVPQGLAYVAEKDWLIVALDFDGERTSMLGAVNAESGRLESSITLLEQDGSPHRGHVGGLAVSSQYLWVASAGIFRVPLQAITEADAIGAVRLQPAFQAEVLGGAATFHDGVLWVAEFVHEGKTDRGSAHHIVNRNGRDSYAWITGYKLNDDDNLASDAVAIDRKTTPDCVITGPTNMQGLAFFRDRLVVSTSYGRANPSKLYVAADPRLVGATGVVRAESGESVPYWDLGAASEINVVKFAPMAEGIATAGERLALVTESGAQKYLKGGKGPLDYFVFLTPPENP